MIIWSTKFNQVESKSVNKILKGKIKRKKKHIADLTVSYETGQRFSFSHYMYYKKRGKLSKTQISYGIKSIIWTHHWNSVWQNWTSQCNLKMLILTKRHQILKNKSCSNVTLHCIRYQLKWKGMLQLDGECYRSMRKKNV